MPPSTVAEAVTRRAVSGSPSRSAPAIAVDDRDRELDERGRGGAKIAQRAVPDRVAEAPT
jgi:hypothetical protein